MKAHVGSTEMKRSEKVNVRMRPAEQSEIVEAAARAVMTVSEWARMTLLTAARRGQNRSQRTQMEQ